MPLSAESGIAPTVPFVRQQFAGAQQLTMAFSIPEQLLVRMMNCPTLSSFVPTLRAALLKCAYGQRLIANVQSVHRNSIECCLVPINLQLQKWPDLTSRLAIAPASAPHVIAGEQNLSST
jgi:hypothetical protein